MNLADVSINAQVVFRTKTKKYQVPDFEETSLELLQKMIEAGDYTMEFIPAWIHPTHSATLIIEEKTDAAN